MGGRFVAPDGHANRSHVPQDPVTQHEEGDDGVDESEFASSGQLGPDAESEQDQAAQDDIHVEMVLCRHDFDLLQAFHRLVPLPALQAKILHVVCDDDLQVAEEDSERLPPAASDRIVEEETAESFHCIKPLSPLSSAVLISRAKHQSPLTRRLSTQHPAKGVPGVSLTKPRREINLAAQTPRIKMLPTNTTQDARRGDDRVG